MPQRDYILRLIEQMGQMLIELRNKVLGRSASRADLSQAFARVSAQTGIDLTLARAATPETLRMLVAPTGDVEPGRCWLVAEMLAVDGMQSAIEGRPDEARSAFDRARALFTLLEPGGAFLVGLPEARERIEELDARLARLDAVAGHRGRLEDRSSGSPDRGADPQP